MPHTKGPWLLNGPKYSVEPRCGHDNCEEHPRELTGYWLYGAGGVWVADVHGEHVMVPLAEIEPNALLIAAAPDLLESLSEIVSEWGYPNTPKWHKAKAAIAKATGESK